jgi:hypothetical protein
MNHDPESEELLPLNTIRVETILSRFPVHRLSKRGIISIDINERDESGEIKTRWEVSYNSKYGQPGALAYKVDTLIINRRIEESSKPLPEIIKLGSLKEIGDELGLADSGKNRNDIKRALHQNAAAYITAKRSYKGSDGAERAAEVSDTRYGIIFTGEKFPDGRKADAVYIILHRAYREILNNAPIRPLDYDYLKDLSPGAQRFYELLSYQIYAALKNDRPRAKLLYSFYCARAPQTRYLDYNHVKKQMYKVHAPHKRSGYITTVELRETQDDAGQPDWEMLYTPGRKARSEFRAFKRSVRAIGTGYAKQAVDRKEQLEQPAAVASQVIPDSWQRHEELVSQLIGFKVSEKKARELVGAKPEAVRLHLRAVPYLPDGQGKKNFAGRLVTAIENDYELPAAFAEAMEQERRAKVENERDTTAKTCPYCKELSGWRYIKGNKGPVRRCTHDPAKENRY